MKYYYFILLLDFSFILKFLFYLWIKLDIRENSKFFPDIRDTE